MKDQTMLPKYVHILTPTNLRACSWPYQEDLGGADHVKDVERGQLSWSVQADPV